MIDRKLSLRFERRILYLALLTGLPGTAVALWTLWVGQTPSPPRWFITALLLSFWLGLAFMLRQRVRYPLRTISNLLGAIRDGDFSIRMRGGRYDDALGEVIVEVNALGSMLREQRLGALEATALLRTVITEIDVAILTFDQDSALRLVNREGERLLGRTDEQLIGQHAAELGIEDLLSGEPQRMLTRSFPGGMGRWALRRGSFRQGGLPHQVVVLTDLSRALRDEERQAWQRLVRVLGHELNNSLAPIRSLADSLEKLLGATPRADDWEDDMREGLSVIASRAAALSRFMEAYSRLARLPEPRKSQVPVAAWVARAVDLESRLEVVVEPGPDIRVLADGDQLDQLLINLVNNAADAAIERQNVDTDDGQVRLGWRTRSSKLELWVQDNGPGLESTANLFVPFFTTKPGGTGIGLALCRQIAEAHGGTLTLENRGDAPGCIARFVLPLK